MAVPRFSAAFFNPSTLPFKFPFIVAAIFSAAPSELSSSFAYPLILSVPSVSTSLTAFNDRAVNVVLRAADLSALPRPSTALSTSPSISLRSLKFPSESFTLTETFPIFIAPSSIFEVMSLITAERAVPASEPFVPWLARASSMEVVVVMPCPAECIVAAQLLNASPSCCVEVLLLACAYAISSTIFPASFASSPKALR